MPARPATPTPATPAVRPVHHLGIHAHQLDAAGRRQQSGRPLGRGSRSAAATAVLAPTPTPAPARHPKLGARDDESPHIVAEAVGVQAGFEGGPAGDLGGQGVEEDGVEL